MSDRAVHHPRSLRVAAVLAVAIAVAAVAVAVARGGEGPLDAARAELDDDRAFATARGAGGALLRASTELQDAAERCSPRDGDGPSLCNRLFTAAAVTRVSAVAVLDCTRPAIFRVRREMRSYLDELADGRDPEPPTPPDC